MVNFKRKGGLKINIMKNLTTIKHLIEKKKNSLEKEYHLKSIGIFGSYSQGKASEKSDLDMLVEFSQPPTLFKFIRLERQLSRILRTKVDLVTRSALKPLIKKNILNETVFL